MRKGFRMRPPKIMGNGLKWVFIECEYFRGEWRDIDTGNFNCDSEEVYPTIQEAINAWITRCEKNIISYRNGIERLEAEVASLRNQKL